MEGNFLKMPNGQEGNSFVRKSNNLSDNKFKNLKNDWEKREIRDENGRFGDFFSKHELKKTSEQRKVLDFVVNETNIFLEKFTKSDARASIDLIKLVDAEFFTKNFAGMSASGVCLPANQCIAILVNEKTTKTEMAEIAFHEFMHLFGFGKIGINGGTANGYADISFERFGLAIVSKDQKTMFFNQINEAITTELTNRFHEHIRKSPLFKDDIWILKNTYEANENFPPILVILEDENGKSENSARVSYVEEYARTMATIETIYKKNQEQFSSKEEVLEVFLEAYFSGKLLPIARLIEKTYGKGGFRMIGEESAVKS